MENARTYAKGIGDAVADRTINRKIVETVTPYEKTIKVPRQDDTALDAEVAAYAKSQGLLIDGYHVPRGNGHIVEIDLNVIGHIRTETWADVAERVARGSATLEPRGEKYAQREYESMSHHLRQASLLMSGRHLQHGDETQHTRNMEVFTNCATSAASFLTFYLLLNGCFRAGTLVKMEGGTYKPIEEIKLGESVISYDENSKEFVTQRVDRLNINKPKPMVKVRLENGEEIVCTEDHKFLTKSGEWIEARHLSGLEVKTHA